MSAIAINHVAFYCRDIAAQEAFYSKHFGFKRSRTFRAGTPKEFFMLKLGSVRLEFFPTDPAQVSVLRLIPDNSEEADSQGVELM